MNKPLGALGVTAALAVLAGCGTTATTATHPVHTVTPTVTITAAPPAAKVACTDTHNEMANYAGFAFPDAATETAVGSALSGYAAAVPGTSRQGVSETADVKGSLAVIAAQLGLAGAAGAVPAENSYQPFVSKMEAACATFGVTQVFG
jgi:hypothetical protein